MANSLNLDQTAPIGVVCSESTLFASILSSSVMLGDDFSRRHFQMLFFLGAFRVKFIRFVRRIAGQSCAKVQPVWVSAKAHGLSPRTCRKPMV